MVGITEYPEVFFNLSLNIYIKDSRFYRYKHISGFFLN